MCRYVVVTSGDGLEQLLLPSTMEEEAAAVEEEEEAELSLKYASQLNVIQTTAYHNPLLSHCRSCIQ